MKKYILTALLLLLAAVLVLSGCGGSSPSSSQASDPSWEKVKEKGEFVLGLDENFPPMGFRDEKGEIVGFDVDVAKEVTSRLGVKLKLQPINWDAKEQELNTGNIDAIWNGFTITEDRKQNVLFSKPYMKNRQVIIVMNNSNFTNLADLAGKKLGLQAGSSAADALAGAKDFKAKLGEVVEFDDNMTALMDLEKGGIDAVLMDEIVARYYITMKNKGYKVLDEALASEEYGIGFRKNDKQLMEKIQRTLEAMAKDGKLAEISTKWFGKDITTVGK
ncbi:family 3 extracellular solute-binding protein [Thermincola ferriacetica]|uniref:Extracellular solute-binding protein family 3 n=2 Tax=Thermincola TaxID=278993 RepID=D5XAK4_THEPJ|nr:MULTISPECIES: amino acid ABC transporter substrate-binding protein [Thermincola]ADG81303.1 extracellular solute-binding protein family 3 [Thermincola potens JR]KNZ68643.1 family 3 extracellular solute-binding protein [Thermincola ferriacetica]